MVNKKTGRVPVFFSQVPRDGHRAWGFPPPFRGELKNNSGQSATGGRGGQPRLLRSPPAPRWNRKTAALRPRGGAGAAAPRGLPSDTQTSAVTHRRMIACSREYRYPAAEPYLNEFFQARQRGTNASANLIRLRSLIRRS